MFKSMYHKDKGVVFDLHNGVVQYTTSDGGTRRSRLGKKENELLRFLVSNQNKVISKEVILEEIWHDRVVCENSASVALSNIRRLLKKADEDCACLITLSGAGYVFNSSKSGFVLESNDLALQLAPILVEK